MKFYTKHTYSPSQSRSSVFNFFRTILTLPFRILFHVLNTIYKILNTFLPHRLRRRLSPTQRLFLNVVLAGIFVIFGIWIYTSFINPEQSEASWFNDSWQYRQQISLTSTGSAQLNSQVKLLSNFDASTLVSDGKLQSDLDDLRFVTNTGKIIPYWIEDSTNGSVDVWGFVPSIPSSGATIFMYYGNSSAQAGKIKVGSAQYPGISCKAVLTSGENRDGVYFIDPDGEEGSDKYRVYCDNSYDSGGWTMLMKATQGTTFNYEANYWTTANTLNPEDASRNDGDAKYQSFNELKITDIMARWPDAGDIRWLKNAAWTAMPALTGFNTFNNWGIPQEQPDWNGTYFSAQVKQCDSGPGAYGTKLKDIGGYNAGARWGYRFNENGCGNWASDDAGSGIGVWTDRNAAWRYSAGDWTNCCATLGMRRAARVEVYGRETTIMIEGGYITASSPTSEEQSQGPIAYWKFDEGQGSTTNDSTSNALSGTITGATWQPESQCIAGKCLFFDGSDDYINAGGNSVLNLTSSYSVTQWIKPQADFSTFSMKGHYTTSGNNSGWTARVDGNRIKWYLENNAEVMVQSSPNSIELNKWYHVSLIFDGSTASIYINGKLDGSGSATVGDNSSYPYEIGRKNHTGGPNQYFKGYIDEVKIYPVALSSDQVKANFNARGTVQGTSVGIGGDNNTTLSNGLVGYWKMDESSANTCSGGTNDSCDTSGNGNDGAWTGNATTSSAGKFGSSTTLDGTGDYITIPDSTNSSLDITGAWTISSWVYINSSEASYGHILAKRGGSTNYALRVGSSGNTWDCYFYNSGYKGLWSQGSVLKDQWSYITCTYDGKGTMKIYQNGVEVASSNALGLPATPDNTSVELGSYGGGNEALDGKLDEARLYNRALSPSEISQLYNYAPSPVVYFDFEDKGVSSLTDKSGNGHNGTWNGTGTHYDTGKYGLGGKFNGSDDWVNVGALGVTGSSTVEAWVYPEDTGSTGTYGIMGNSQATRLTWSGTTFQYFINNNSWTPTYKYVSQSGTSPLNRWYHVAGVRDADTGIMRIYINGVLNNTTTGTPTDAVSDLGWTIVKRDSNIGFKGKMDEIKVYNYARTQGQIISDMNAGHPLGGSPVGSQTLYYRFDEGYGTTLHDSGPNRIDGTMDSGATWSNDGKFAKALKTDGTGTGDASIPDNDAIDFAYNQDFTVSFWMKDGGGNANTDSVVEKWSSSGGYPYVFRYNASGSLYMARYDGTNNPIVQGSKTINDGRWHNIVGQKSGSTLYLYIDGIRQTTGTTDTTTGTTTNSSPIFLGTRNGSLPWNGYLDELKIYGAALSADEIKIDYNRNAGLALGASSTDSDGKTASNSASRSYCVPGDTSTCSPPVGEWLFEEGRGTSANDTSGNGKTGSITGARWSQGKNGGGLLFDGNGNGDLVDVGDWSAVEQTTVTFTAWVKFNSLNSDSDIITKGIHNQNQPLVIWRDEIVGAGVDAGNTDAISVIVYDGTTQVWYATPSNSLNDTNWHHIAVVIVPSTRMDIYIDGVLKRTGSLSNNGILNNTSSFRIGADTNSGQEMNGIIDEVKAYNYARTPSQIAWDYNQGAPIAHWRMDDCQGSTLRDASRNGNNGTITIGGSGTQTSVGTCQTASTAWGNGATGKFNYSLNFDGSDDYVNIGDPASGVLDISDDITVSAWVKPATLTGFHSFVSKEYRGEFELGASDTSLVWRHGNGTTYSGPSWSNFFSEGTGVWYHIVAVRNTSDATITVYKNGKQFSTPTAYTTTPAASSNSVYIGARSGGSFYHSGQIDDVQIFNYSLNQTQIRNLMNQGGAVRFGPATGTP